MGTWLGKNDRRDFMVRKGRQAYVGTTYGSLSSLVLLAVFWLLFVISAFGLCVFSCCSQDRLVRIAITTGLNVITFPIRSGPKQKDVIVDENG